LLNDFGILSRSALSGGKTSEFGSADPWVDPGQLSLRVPSRADAAVGEYNDPDANRTNRDDCLFL
jgi:hypothetical protein